MQRRHALENGETYHIYNRGAHKSAIFFDHADYIRFAALLFLGNSSAPTHISNLSKEYRGPALIKIFEEAESDKSLVDVLAYCLMPNHFHLVLRQKNDGGIERFMRKLATAYSMYFNTKYAHSGVLFQGRYKSRLVDDEAYYRYLFAYIHLNPIEIIEPNWKEKGITNYRKVEAFVKKYPHSSFIDYSVKKRPEGIILAEEDVPEFLASQNDLEELLACASANFIKDRP
jgi:putative transposase